MAKPLECWSHAPALIAFPRTIERSGGTMSSVYKGGSMAASVLARIIHKSSAAGPSGVTFCPTPLKLLASTFVNNAG